MREFLQRLKFVKGSDLIAIFPMIFGGICAPVYKFFHPNFWLVCERKNEARDNGYCFYKYMKENHPEQEVFYAINKKSVDYCKVEKYGKVIQYSSLKHWICYFAAEINISSQKEGKPNAALCFVLEVYLGMTKNRAYIRHGICKDDQKWVYYDVSKIQLFVCSAEREFQFISERFGYPKGNVKLIGLCRFDELFKPHEVKRQILIMPTWREWLGRISIDTKNMELGEEFEKSEYYQKWSSLLNNEELHLVLEKYKYEMIFYPHASMQKYVHHFKTLNKNIVIANDKHYDVQRLLMESTLLITDYSSVYFDFAFMKKPMLYYQFDYKKYRQAQYQEGYFSYKKDGFGVVVKEEDVLINNISETIKTGMRMPDMYIERVDKFFCYKDNKNCERTYYAIREMKNEKE